MDTSIVRDSSPEVAAETVEAHYSALERPHACIDGTVYIGHLVEHDGEEVEVFEGIPCKRCRVAEDR